ncbi:hypothetical protein HK100_009543 [Physocladia obscura]|uniref:GH26 domain-containing protein n=1 Tax=Physocladia obscura TaxID=109957 RepID=A0AAD5T986_9FUNG|nr:hypothetical protein HK100_009543 [Physocladia obscura]
MKAVWPIFLSAIAGVTLATAPLEPPAGKLLFGAWYDRNNSDTPSDVNTRFNYKPLSFFQTDIDFSGVVKPWTAPTITTQFLQQLEDTNTDAIAFLTVYPFQGFANITGSNFKNTFIAVFLTQHVFKLSDAQLADMAQRLNDIVNAGHSVFFRFASEMNGSWFPYGQDPIGFISAWIRCITYWRNALGSNASKVAFIWSPNSGNGYPYPDETYSFDANNTSPANLANLKVLDTNNNGKLDAEDDPYLPYYPGDDYVDWTNLMTFIADGTEYDSTVGGWDDNSIPVSGKFEHYLNGDTTDPETYGYAPFYTYFASSTGSKNSNGTVVSAGSKPLIISETAATYHFAWIDPIGKPAIKGNATRLEIKQGWYEQFLTADFISNYPQMKAVSTFEFIKSEEVTWRDFTVFGMAPDPDPTSPNFTADANGVAAAISAYAQSLDFITYANVTSSSSSSAGSFSTVKSGAVGGNDFSGLFAIFVSLGTVFLSGLIF